LIEGGSGRYRRTKFSGTVNGLLWKCRQFLVSGAMLTAGPLAEMIDFTRKNHIFRR
jgi:hypothetical protein